MPTSLRQLMPRIFISHSTKDTDNAFCLKLASDLRLVLGNKTSIWLDRLSLVGGDEWKRIIEQELAGCGIFIVVLSPDALEAHWVNYEMNIAFQRKKPWKKIIPIHFLQCDIHQIRSELKDQQMVSFLNRSYEDGFKDLLAALFEVQHQEVPRRNVLFGLVGLAGLLVGGGSGFVLRSAFPPSVQASTPTSAPCPVVRPYAQSHTYFGHKGEVDTVAWSPDGSSIASGSRDKTVQVWNPVTGDRIYTYINHTEAVYGVTWSPDGKKIASASDDKTVQVCSAANGEQLLSYQGHTDMVLAVAWSPDSKHIVSGSQDTTLHVWDAITGNRLLAYTGHLDYVDGVAWAPDGKHIVSAAGDHTAQVWDAVTGTRSFIYRGHNDIVRGVAWSPDGKKIASASADRTAQAWNATTGNLIFTFGNHCNWVHDVSWSPDNIHVASSNADHSIQVWQL